jgi:hypothetical protein
VQNVKLTPSEQGIESMEMRNAERFSGFCRALKLVIRDGDQLNKFREPRNRIRVRRVNHPTAHNRRA